MREQSVNIMVRRNYIYEDAFEKLSPENEPNLRLKMRVHLINVAGKLSFLWWVFLLYLFVDRRMGWSRSRIEQTISYPESGSRRPKTSGSGCRRPKNIRSGTLLLSFYI
jgi:hypothetical protein